MFYPVFGKYLAFFVFISILATNRVSAKRTFRYEGSKRKRPLFRSFRTYFRWNNISWVFRPPNVTEDVIKSPKLCIYSRLGKTRNFSETEYFLESNSVLCFSGHSQNILGHCAFLSTVCLLENLPKLSRSSKLSFFLDNLFRS